MATIILGHDVWPAFIHGLAEAKHYLETDIPLSRMPTVFALSRQAGCSLVLAYSLHALVALTAVIVLLNIWSRDHRLQTRGTALVAATLLISPYLFDYDLVWYVLPMAWLYQLGAANGWRYGERLTIYIAWMLLLYLKLALYLLTGKVILLGALVSLALLWFAYQHAGESDNKLAIQPR